MARPRVALLGGTSVSVAVLVAGAVVVLAVVVLGVGVGVDRGARRSDTAAVATTTTTEPAPPPGPVELGPIVRVRAGVPDDGFPASYPAVGGLAASTVLQLRVSGFTAHAVGRAQQCISTDTVACGNGIAVQFGADGTASFQYLVVDDFVADAVDGRCRAAAPPCSVVVDDDGGGRRAEVHTVFGDEAPTAGQIHVSPRTGLVDGQAVVVEVEGYPPGARVDAMLCAAPDARGSRRCGAPGPTAPMTVGPDGAARATLTIRAGPVGEGRVPCGRGHVCGISVVADGVFARAPVVPVRFAGPPGPDYDVGRLVGGAAVTALLVAGAAQLVRRTDWSPIGEEAAPQIDDAEYADLDALVAAMPPEEEPVDAVR